MPLMTQKEKMTTFSTQDYQNDTVLGLYVSLVEMEDSNNKQNQYNDDWRVFFVVRRPAAPTIGFRGAFSRLVFAQWIECGPSSAFHRIL
jgi:hypothetical protein